MKHRVEKGIYTGDVYTFYNIEEAEQHKSTEHNWAIVLDEFKKFYNKKWVDTNNIRYLVNNKPVYKEWTVVGVEDNNAWADYYWVLRDNKGLEKYELVNNRDFEKHIKNGLLRRIN